MVCVSYECLFVGFQLFVLGLTDLLRFSDLHLGSHWSVLCLTGLSWVLLVIVLGPAGICCVSSVHLHVESQLSL